MILLPREVEIIRVGVERNSIEWIALIFAIFLCLISYFCLFERRNVPLLDYRAIGGVNFED